MMFLMLLSSVFALLGLGSLAVWRKLTPANLGLFVVGSLVGCICGTLTIVALAKAHPLTEDPGMSYLHLLRGSFVVAVLLGAEAGGLLLVWLKTAYWTTPADISRGPGLTPDR